MKKTYSVTHNPSNRDKSKHNLPDDMLVKLNSNKRLDVISGSYHWSNSAYGFIISDEELAKYTPLYLSSGGKPIEVYVVDISNMSQYDKDNHNYLFSTNDWVFTFRTKQYYKNAPDKKFTYLQIYRGLSKGPQKLFTSVDDMINYYTKEHQKRTEKYNAERKKIENTNNGPLQFETPKRKIVSINKETNHIPGAKVGDEIYGAIEVLNNEGKSVMCTQSSYVNYVIVYLNGQRVNSIPMSTFAHIMATNFVFEH